jgi:hypothetical protein
MRPDGEYNCLLGHDLPLNKRETKWITWSLTSVSSTLLFLDPSDELIFVED